MYLKRLDLQGFKSFANKTSLEFGTGVTCVIGPNGTGKTNVADAIRWVLGEHASRTLRARKTEDVIFAGSDKRSAMGVVEVSIVLDNTSQWLPIEFADVVVTRRAYRNGENEYYINGARVRLRDVVELFMRAQVGQNSYAFMGQGMVEQVLSLRPEDRRALIEEAADVRLYRHKLEDAQHKLKATRENLERVQLLVREIEPRITQLERQAGRAIKYQDLTRELAATLHVWYSHQWHEVNAALLAAVAAQDQRTEELDRVRAEAKACDDGLTQLRAAIQERREEIAVREGRLRNMEDYARDLERRVGLDAERTRLLGARVEELGAEVETLRGDRAAQDAAGVAPDTAEMQTKLEQEQADLAAHRARLAAVEDELRALERSALAGEQLAASATALAGDLARRAADAEDAAARLQREADASTQERRQAIVALATWARDYARLAADAAATAPELAAAIDARARSSESLAAARREQAALEEELRDLRALVSAIEARIDVLEAVEVQPQAPDAGVRLILEAGGIVKREHVPAEIELTGVVGLVGQLLRVPPGLEKAIEAALAENLFAIVLERHADVQKVVDLLLEGDAGRATMYALDNVQELRSLNLIKERGIVGVASRLVRCDARYRRLIDTLLGRTVVVEDLPLAYRVVRRGLAGAVATLDGVLVRPIGAVAAGSLTSVQASFMRERELGDLPEELARLRPQIEERETRLRDALRRIAEADQALAGGEPRIETLRERRSRLDAGLAAARAGLGAFHARLTDIAANARRAASEAERLRETRAQFEAERSMRVTEAADARARELADRDRAAALEAERGALAAAADELAATVAHHDGLLRSERQVTQAERIARDRLARQIATKDEQRTRAEREAHEIATRLAATERELSERTAEVEALRGELEPARQELSQFESRERTLTAELAEANARMHNAERLFLEAQNDVRVRRDELESLRASLESEGFVATDEGEIERAPEPEPEPEDEPAEAYAQAGDLPSWMRTEDGADGRDLPPVRGGSTINPTEVRDRIADLRAQIRNLGPVNEQAAADYADSRDRYDFLTGQLTDLRQAEEQLNEAIAELEGVIRERFRSTFKLVNREFERYFSAFFRGGTARLELGETDDEGMPGIEIVAQPPGKKLGSLALLSGGERSLTAVALLFALLQANPSPICVLDEVDAALDEANVGRFVEELRELAQRTQFIIITHNRRTIENADTIYGVSMGADSVSRILSLRLADVPKDLLD